MATLHRIEAEPDLADRVYRNLLDAISKGTLAPGVRLTQEDIAEQLAVSRQPVLQAIRLLKKDGFVLDAPGRGVCVAPLDADWLRNVYQVRSALDALAARLACEGTYRRDGELFTRARKAMRGKDIGAMIECDIAFHEGIYRAANNPLIAQSAQLHWQHIRRAMGAVLQSTQMRSTVWDEHEAIANAIVARNAKKADALMRAHGEQAGTHLHDRLTATLQKKANG
jgi:DNA-binding GntR family transcriptional regulator